ncbi:MAG: hypothetical protein CVT70_06000 [Alphaproteobacteria bacterium HGW-Alphaproteobacteria-1]|nr:MAG: hypothetical protein CVT70_06000 [Alphaproteobacteria bacterium HGW-Alphaproteobacteria-1]
MEIVNESSSRSWSLAPGNRLVKVVGPPRSADSGELKSVTGYFTQEKYLFGLSCTEIERVLGLRPNELAYYANVYSFAWLPKSGEFEYKMSAAFPGGEVFDESKKKDFFDKRAAHLETKGRYKGAYDADYDAYPPGSDMVPQWTLKAGVSIPVGAFICSVTRVTPFPRSNGSVERYKPHNRVPIA